MDTVLNPLPTAAPSNSGVLSYSKESPRPALVRLFSRIGEVSSLPSTAAKVISMVGRDGTHTEELLQIIETDPALAMLVLRRVNSAYYGLCNKVADLKDAFNLLGFREVRNLALTVHVSSLFQQPGDYRTYSRNKLWTHSVCVATVARMISVVSQRAIPDEAYVAGLLHDVGFILLDQHLRRHFCNVLDSIEEDKPTTKIEQAVFSFDHSELGGFVAKQWSFPQQITDAILYHHSPQSYQGPYKEIVNVTTIANYLCSRTGYPSLGVHNVPLPSDQLYASLDIDQAELRMIWEELEGTLEKAIAMSAV